MLLIAALVIVVNLLVDLLYGLHQSAHPPWQLSIDQSPTRPARDRSERRRRPRRLREVLALFPRESRRHARPRRHRGCICFVAIFADVAGAPQPDRAIPRQLRCSRRSGRRAAPGSSCSAPTTSGRDMLSRIIYGARLSLLHRLIVVTLSSGRSASRSALLAGFFRGIVDIADHARDGHHLVAARACCSRSSSSPFSGPSLTNAMIAVAIVLLPHYVAADARRGADRDAARTM